MPDLIGHPFPTKKQGLTVDQWVEESVSGTVPIRKRRLGRPKGSSRKFDRVMAEMESILSELQDGASMTSVAKRYGVNRNTLRRYLSRMQQPESPYI